MVASKGSGIRTSPAKEQQDLTAGQGPSRMTGGHPTDRRDITKPEQVISRIADTFARATALRCVETRGYGAVACIKSCAQSGRPRQQSQHLAPERHHNDRQDSWDLRGRGSRSNFQVQSKTCRARRQRATTLQNLSHMGTEVYRKVSDGKQDPGIWVTR